MAEKVGGKIRCTDGGFSCGGVCLTLPISCETVDFSAGEWKGSLGMDMNGPTELGQLSSLIAWFFSWR